MPRHMMLTAQPDSDADMEFSAMSGDRADKGHSQRTAGYSVFRPGQTRSNPPVTLDLATGREIFSQPLALSAVNPARVWESLGPVTLSANHLIGNGLLPESSSDPAAGTFDILRTRLLLGLAQRGWRRIAVTSPTHGCGKSFVASNLALSLARHASSRTVLMDLDLRRPALADLWGVKDLDPIEEYLSGEQPLESHFRRFGRTLALAFSSAPCAMAAERLHDPDTQLALDSMLENLDPEVVIYDLPPALVSDDLLALAPCIDAVLLVTDGTRTSPAEIRATEQLLDGRLPLLGVVLNRAQDRSAGRLHYDKG